MQRITRQVEQKRGKNAHIDTRRKEKMEKSS